MPTGCWEDESTNPSPQRGTVPGRLPCAVLLRYEYEVRSSGTDKMYTEQLGLTAAMQRGMVSDELRSRFLIAALALAGTKRSRESAPGQS